MRLRVGRVCIENSTESEKKLYKAANMPWMIITDDEKINEIFGYCEEWDEASWGKWR